MSLFNFFRNQTHPLGSSPNEGSTISEVKTLNGHSDELSQKRNNGHQSQTTEKVDVPEHVFIEYEKPKPKASAEPNEVKSEVNDLQSLYRYLEQSLEKNGYEDALTNPDTSYMEEQIQYINNDLGLLIAKIKTYYSGHMRNVDFHIDTRKRNGMIETVDELLSYRETILEDTRKVSEIETDAKKEVGLSQNLVLSYRRGFRKGFAAITYGTVLGRKQ
jgi:hypothetical protein